MTARKLWVEAAPDRVRLDDLIWRSGDTSSIQANLDPDLSMLGEVPHRSRDAVWLAVAAFLADRTVHRLKGWTRDIEVTVPVSDAARWRSAASRVETTLSFLTSDQWSVSPVSQDVPLKPGPSTPRPEGNLVCLFSGGADSFCGAVRAIREGYDPILVSHWDWSNHAAIQRDAAAALERVAERQLPHIQVRLGKQRCQVDGTVFPNEPSRRSRSLLFIALGLAVAAAGEPLPLWVPENGFASLNPPLAPERRGSLSTRTTHPTFFAYLRELLRVVSANNDFRNPFNDSTKGEIFEHVKTELGDQRASEVLSKTHSCSHSRWAGRFGYPPATHCGVCFGCVVRRAAFLRSGIRDRTTYLVDELSRSERREFLSFGTAAADIQTFRYAQSREVGAEDVLALSLPESYDRESVQDLMIRGFEELSKVPFPT